MFKIKSVLVRQKYKAHGGPFFEMPSQRLLWLRGGSHNSNVTTIFMSLNFV